MPLNKEETTRLFDKLDRLTASSIRVDERVSHIKDTLDALRDLPGRVSILEALRPRRKPMDIMRSWKAILVAVTGLLTAMGGAWAMLGGGH